MIPKTLVRAMFSALVIAASLAQAAPRPAAAIPASSVSLQSLSKAVLEQKSLAQQRLLGKFAEQNREQLSGMLARLALGYAAMQDKKYAEAVKQFEAARANPTLLQDYAEYYEAVSELALGNNQDAATLLNGFASRYPSSPLAPRATLQLAETLLALQRVSEAVPLLESPPQALPEPEATLLLGEAYQKSNRSADAVTSYRTVYYSYPASAEAEEAERHLKQLQGAMGAAFPAATAELWHTRADKLYDASRWADSLTAYRTMASLTTGAMLDHAQVGAAACQYQMGSTGPALTALEKLQLSDPDSRAERLYLMASAYRRLDRADRMEQQLQQLGKEYADSQWNEQALMMAGNYFFQQKDYEKAGDYYQMSYKQFPHGDNAAMSHWRVAWQAYRERRWPEAKHLLEEHILNFPSSPQLSAALYWLGRVMERESPAAAVPYYQKIVDVFPNYYYGLLARERLEELTSLPAGSAVPPEISLDQIERAIPVSPPADSAAASEQPTRERVRLLESAWLIDWAIAELRSVTASDPSAAWAGSEMARLEQERGRYHMALRYAKRSMPNYFSQNLSDLSRNVWELLFPRPWWDQLQKQAAAAKVDPFLLAGLIRQESEFDPQAKSRSNARGLMQLLPSTARMMARKVPDSRARRYRLASLYSPDINLVYGTFYFKQVLDQFGGTVEYALAGYNAGENRVAEWLKDGPFEEPAEFVESIPFTETRDYVQAVLRNAALYRALYSEGK
jgi:peptidoglycan lytic transglycosylase